GKLNPTTEVFDGTAWKRVSDLPTPREHLGMATDGNFAYVVGGRDLSSDKNSSALERYDPKTAWWAALPAQPPTRGTATPRGRPGGRGGRPGPRRAAGSDPRWPTGGSWWRAARSRPRSTIPC